MLARLDKIQLLGRDNCLQRQIKIVGNLLQRLAAIGAALQPADGDGAPCDHWIARQNLAVGDDPLIEMVDAHGVIVAPALSTPVSAYMHLQR